MNRHASRLTPFRTATALAAVAALVTACGGPADAFRDAVPTTDTVKLELPEQSAQALHASGSTLQQGLEGETAELYRLTRGATRAVNGGVALVLGLVESIVLHRPTTVTEDQAVWGPHTPDLAPNTWKLTVTRTAEETYDYVLEGKGKAEGDDAWVVVLSGTHTRAGVRRYGTGEFLLDFDARATLAEHDGAVGQAQVTYDRPAEDQPVQIDVAFRQVRDDETGELIDADYRYLRTPGVGGEFEFAVDKDAEGDPAVLETLTIKSRWLTAGAGRSDVKATGGDFGTAEHTLNECWDDLFGSVWMDASFTVDPRWNYGDAARCAFTDAEYPAQ